MSIYPGDPSTFLAGISLQEFPCRNFLAGNKAFIVGQQL
jgi:hypothetical protein